LETARPLRVAIIGAGPAAFYAADALLQNGATTVSVDMFDRKLTPFGLVRDGVAPDHQKIKSVTRIYDKIASLPNYRFFGNVHFGNDICHDDIRAYYDAVIYAVGAQSDRRMGVPGEDLHGSYPATIFVGWYNGHPDYPELEFDLSQENVAIIGQGNVAIDVARILAKTPEELATTDIADHALEKLRQSKVKNIYVIGRRGPAQAAFTNPEIKELGELDGAELVVDPAELELDPLSQAALPGDKTAVRNLETLRRHAHPPTGDKPRRIYVRFLLSPAELLGEDGRVVAIKLQRNRLEDDGRGGVRAVGTGEYETLPAGLVFRSIGYKGVALPGVPHDERSGTIPNERGRVLDPATGGPLAGEYVVGWAKRGPSGIIGTNKPDSVETVKMLLEDAPNLARADDERAAPEAIEALLRARCPRFVSYGDWGLLDKIETRKGMQQGRPRVKFTNVGHMLDAIEGAREQLIESADEPLPLVDAAQRSSAQI
jgi:ferredoxin--NADP+ reductase